MHVLHIIDKLSMDGKNPSSCTVLFGDWSPCLKESNCDIEVLCLANDKNIAPYLEDRNVPTSFIDCPKHSMKNIDEIARHVENTRCDLIHLHGYGAAHFGRVAAARTRVPNIVHEHAVLPVRPQHYVVDWLLRNKTDAAIAVSEYVKQFMIKGRSIPDDRIRVIGNGINLSRFRPLSIEKTQEVRQKLGIPGDSKIIGTVTRFRVEKGNEYLIKAFKLIRSKYSNVQLVVIGDGPDRDALHHLAKVLKVNDAISWLGFRKDVEEVMPIFDVHVIPSLTEGYPLALAEGMAVGNAMIVAEVGGMREIGVNRKNVLFVPPACEQSISKACQELFEQPRLARMIANNGARKSAEMSINSSAAKLIELYEEVKHT